jgi:putative ATP-dependent endonuclease of the OLD family
VLGLEWVRNRYTFDEEYGEKWLELSASDRNRIQMVYVPATRDGARQVNAFLRGRVWRASQWSDPFREHVGGAADELSEKFKGEAVVEAVTKAISTRWQELHHLTSEQNPMFEPINRDVSVLVANAEMLFEPSPTGRTRPARELSDGQQSLLHIALTAATLDLEGAIANGDHDDKFDLTATALPSLTLVALEEPENNLAPFFLSRVVQQLLDVTQTGRAQTLISSHSASVLSRIPPEQVRHFRLDEATKTTRVGEIFLPDDCTEAGKYIREAVRAHPELYFARFVVLGEGDSEAFVLPKLAAARGLHIDQSFVAVVPLGGRHTNHFWRLLTQLGIPYATLLDLDWGRSGGGEGRVRDACTRLLQVGLSPFDGSEEIDGFNSTDDIDDLDSTQLVAWLNHLEKWDIYFSAPLDLDMLLLTKFKSAYTDHLEDGQKGPSSQGDPRDAVLGEPGVRPDVAYWTENQKIENLRWYRRGGCLR